MTYGCKIMVSLTLCRFLDHPVYKKYAMFRGRLPFHYLGN